MIIGKNAIQSVKSSCFSQVQMLELDACTRCQECVGVCPVILEGYPDGAMERISDWKQACKSPSILNLVLKKDTGRTNYLEKVSSSLCRCTTCGICGVVCESGIATTSLWESMRKASAHMGLTPKDFQIRAEAIIRDKNPYGEEQKSRRSWICRSTGIDERASILLFAGCTLSYRNSELGKAALRILAASGISFTMLGDDEFCCGSYLFRTGLEDEYAESIRVMIQKILNIGVKEVLIPCSGCLKTIASEWPKLYGSSLPFKVISFPAFIRECIRQGKIRLKPANNLRVVYHDPCHGGRHLMHLLGEDIVFNAPRDVLSAIPGVILMEFENNCRYQSCCGAGGGLKSVDPEMSRSIAQKKLEQVVRMEADILISSCPFCERNFVDAMGDKEAFGVMDLIELVDRVIERQ